MRITPRIATVFFFVLFSHSVFSTNLPNYYPKSFVTNLQNGLQGEALKQELFEILAKAHLQDRSGDILVDDCAGANDCIQHSSLGYSKARQIMFGRIHLEHTKNGYAVRDVYCQILFDETDFRTRPPGPDQIPNGNLINTEHSWPQSRFSSNFAKDLQKSDLNILFPTHSGANSSRSNLQLAEVEGQTSSPCPGTKRGTAQNGGNTTYFEPPDQQKGQSARAILYFSIRYKLAIAQIEEENLRRWHRLFPVTAFEHSRNEQVFLAQGNRNPFIDDPDLVDRISDF